MIEGRKVFISLLLSYPVRLLHDDSNLVYDSHMNDLISKGMQLRYVEGLVPNEILSDVKKGKRSIINDDVIPESILNLALDLAVDHLIQTLLSKHVHAHGIKYIRLSTRSHIEKRAAMFRIKEALADKQAMLENHNVLQGVLSIYASRYESQVENQVRQEVNQLLQLPMIQDNEILCTQNIEAAMSSKSYLVLLADSDGDEMLDPRKVGLSKTQLSETKDHLLPWQVFCHHVGSEVVCSSSTIQTIAVRIVEECRGHLLAIAFVAKWLKNVQDFKLWELALHKMHSTSPSYDILKFHGSLSRIMINTFINFIWDGLSKTQKHCLVRCLFIPRIKDMTNDHALMDDWISSLFMEAKEAENNMRELINHSVFLHVKADGDNKYIWLPEETYEMLQSLHNLNPMLIKKVGLGLTEVTEPHNNEPWPSAVQIELAHNNLSELPESPNWPDLTVLALQGNVDLTKISPLFFVNVPLLRILDLSYTSVRELPTSFYHLEQLRELYLKGCECFTKLPPEIGRLQKLEKLHLEETQIIHLPIEFKELTNMQSLTLYFYEYRGKKKKPYSCSTIIPHGVISKLKGLRHLSIDVNPDDERWHENVQVILPEIVGLECLQTLSLYEPESKLLKLIPTRILQVDFRFIVGSHTQRIISGIPAAVDVKFKQSERSLKFIKGLDVPFEIKTLLKHSKALFLDRHMAIKNLTEFEMMNLKRLRVCILAECKEMQTIVDGRHSCDNSDMLPHLLFLSVSHMKKLRSIWEGPPSPCCFFGMLRSLTLQSCPRLMTLFSLDFLGNLSLLKELIIKDCPKLSTLISHEISELKLDFFLPKLSKLLLVHLPELTSISNGIYIGPSLKEIGFYGCQKLCSLSRKELSSQVLTVIRGETKWWKGLDWSKEVWGKEDPLPMLNSIFSPINEEADILTQLAIYNHDDIDDGTATYEMVDHIGAKNMGSKYMEPQDSLQLLAVRDMTANPDSLQATSSAECPDDISFYYVSSQHHDRQYRDSLFVSQTLGDNVSSKIHSTTFVSHPRESDDTSGGPYLFSDVLSFPENVIVQRDQVKKSAGFGEWLKQLNDDSLHPNDSVAESIQKARQVCQQQQQHIPYEKVVDVQKPGSTAPQTKHRIQWTPELHETFVVAVNRLGGSERATPHAIFNLMKVEGLADEGLTLNHVKSHLQKYRASRFKPEKSERTPEKSIQQIKSPDMDERMRMELQKVLDEQLKGKGIDSSSPLEEQNFKTSNEEHDKFGDKSSSI
ncbi:hypothetical protein RIF29_42352 [Crotalaria pallida]|uniref:HTH myb-type domain-containing protein n=1 Tax=Crotalaria pallida TaxID=3830 RepID=A0AAN9HSB5_CROPI